VLIYSLNQQCQGNTWKETKAERLPFTCARENCDKQPNNLECLSRAYYINGTTERKNHIKKQQLQQNTTTYRSVKKLLETALWELSNVVSWPTSKATWERRDRENTVEIQQK
jgi:hypothetical protein